MEFSNDFTVRAPLERVWRMMQQPEEVAPCIPGAEITETIDDRHYRGIVKIKLGPIQMSYRGDLEMDVDEASSTITLHAKGAESRGTGGASGTVAAHMSDPGDGMTRVELRSQVDVSGKVAQFGRGIMQDVANRQISQFAACLERKLAGS